MKLFKNSEWETVKNMVVISLVNSLVPLSWHALTSCVYHDTVRKTNSSHENSLEPVNSLNRSWRPTRGWQTNTFKNRCTKNMSIWGFQVNEKAEEQEACIRLWQRDAFLLTNRWGEDMALKEWGRYQLLLLDCPNKLITLILSFLCPGNEHTEFTKH